MGDPGEKLLSPGKFLNYKILINLRVKVGTTEYTEHPRKCGTEQLSSEYQVCDGKIWLAI